jgi:hypothetical protein
MIAPSTPEFKGQTEAETKTAELVSSSATWFYAKVIPGIIAGLTGIASVFFCFFVNQPFPIRVMPLTVWVVAILFGMRYYVPAKDVWMDEAGIIVTVGHERFRVAWCQILEITISSFDRPETITLKIKSQAPIGDRITFMPAIRLLPVGVHPTFKKLNQKRLEETKSFIGNGCKTTC